MTATTRFGVLGPVRVWRDDTEIDPGPRPARLILGLLLARSGRPVRTDEIIDLLWCGDPPGNAAELVAGHLNALNRQVIPGLLRHGPGGHRLPTSGLAVDLAAFRQAVARAEGHGARGEVAQAVAYYLEALRHWTGRCGAGLEPTAALHPAFVAVDLERSRAARAMAEIALAAGVSDEVVKALRIAVELDPLDENLQQSLLLILAAGGRAAEAIEGFRSYQRRLAETAGTSPGRRITERYSALVREAARTGSPPVSAGPSDRRPKTLPAQLPAASRHFAAREHELGELAGQLDTGAAGAVVTVAIDGIPGIGKSALAVQWAHQVAGAFPDGQLFINLRGYDEGEQVGAAEAMTGFLTALDVPQARIPSDLEEMTRLYRSVMWQRRMVVLLDNARSLDQVRPLIPGTPGSLVIVTSRRRLTGLAARHDAYLISLGVPSWDEARAVMRRRLGDARAASDPGALDELIAACGRLPLAMSIVAGRAAAHRSAPLRDIVTELRAGGLTLDAFSGDHPAADLRSVCSWSYRHLDAGAARLFRLLAVHPGPDISRAAIASLAGVEPREAARLVGELTLSGLLTEHRPGRYVFHDLVKLYATELSHGPGVEAEENAARVRLVSHLQMTAQDADDRLMPAFSTRLVEVPAEQVTPEVIEDPAAAVAWFDLEIPVLERAVSSVRVDGFRPWQLAYTVMAYCQRVGRHRTWHAIASAGLRAAVETDDRWGVAHMHRMVAGAQSFSDDLSGSTASLLQALALFDDLGSGADQGHVQRNLGWVLYRQKRYDRALDAYQHAEALLALHSGARPQAAAILGIGLSLAGLQRHEQALDTLEIAGHIFAREGDFTGHGACESAMAEIEYERGNFADSIRHQREAQRMYTAAADPANHAEATMQMGRAYLAAGQRDEGMRTLAEADAEAEEFSLTALRERIAVFIADAGDPLEPRRIVERDA